MLKFRTSFAAAITWPRQCPGFPPPRRATWILPGRGGCESLPASPGEFGLQFGWLHPCADGFDILRRMFVTDALALAEDHGALDEISQLADIARHE